MGFSWEPRHMHNENYKCIKADVEVREGLQNSKWIIKEHRRGHKTHMFAKKKDRGL